MICDDARHYFPEDNDPHTRRVQKVRIQKS
jgi:hypothetical protein